MPKSSSICSIYHCYFHTCSLVRLFSSILLCSIVHVHIQLASTQPTVSSVPSSTAVVMSTSIFLPVSSVTLATSSLLLSPLCAHVPLYKCEVSTSSSFDTVSRLSSVPSNIAQFKSRAQLHTSASSPCLLQTLQSSCLSSATFRPAACLRLMSPRFASCHPAPAMSLHSQLLWSTY